jgi:hypothetical protein
MERFTYDDVERERAEIARETPRRRHRVLIDLRAKVGEATEPRHPTPDDDDETRRKLYLARLQATAKLLGEDAFRNIPPSFAPEGSRRPRGGVRERERLARLGSVAGGAGREEEGGLSHK